MPIQETFGENGKCSICKIPEIDTINYGEIHKVKDLTVHLFCLYFSTNLLQQGQARSGIVGFGLRDIRDLIKTSAEQKCCYCHNGSATTHCHYPNCGRVFHQVCGFKNNARFEYLDEFRTFCHEHNGIEHETTEFQRVIGCHICYDFLGEYDPVKTIPSCCNCWFHQQCLRTYSINAGYAFMCPTCRNKNYADFARSHGIYVPEYEAMWEANNVYADIERSYTHCDAINCVCPGGRTFTNQKWALQRCSCCGSFGFHKLCRPKEERSDIIVCDICREVTQPRGQPRIEAQIQYEEAVSLIDRNQRADANEGNENGILDKKVVADVAMVDMSSNNEVGISERNIVWDVDMDSPDEIFNEESDNKRLMAYPMVNENLAEKRKRDHAAHDQIVDQMFDQIID